MKPNYKGIGKTVARAGVGALAVVVVCKVLDMMDGTEEEETLVKQPENFYIDCHVTTLFSRLQRMALEIDKEKYDSLFNAVDDMLRIEKNLQVAQKGTVEDSTRLDAYFKAALGYISDLKMTMKEKRFPVKQAARCELDLRLLKELICAHYQRSLRLIVLI